MSFFVLLFFLGVVVFWPGGGSEPVEKEAGQVKGDAEAKRVSSARPSIRDIERIRARQTGIGTAARANPEADTLYITALRHAKPTTPDSLEMQTS